jgi:hypothetical protein
MYENFRQLRAAKAPLWVFGKGSVMRPGELLSKWSNAHVVVGVQC